MEIDMYLYQILQKYSARDLTANDYSLLQLKNTLQTWASDCYVDILDSGSRAKRTAISLGSDVDYLVSLKSNCNDNNGGLKSCYDSLFQALSAYYPARKQNVSVRINVNGLEVDITPAKKQNWSGNYHSLYLSKSDSWTQTNIQRHITDISQSGRIDEIKVLKIWRELHHIDFPSIYLEYLLVKNILLNRPKGISSLENNVMHVFNELAKTQNNPLKARIVDPANSNNILSDLLTDAEKNKIIYQAQVASRESWNQIVW
jgi:hypothetical protein